MKTKLHKQSNLKIKALLFLLLFTGLANAQIINIPDIFFKGRLMNARPTNNVAMDINGNYGKVDTNNDGEIQVSEAEAVYALNLSDVRFIEDLTGIEYFVNIKSLNIATNMITSIDLSPFPNLIGVICDNNQLTSIDVSMLPLLQSLTCRRNQITDINISGLQHFTYLDCLENQLTSLDVTGLPNLKGLTCQSNPLVSLNLSGLANLEILTCGSSFLTNLDLNTQSGLTYLDCSYSRLTNLDLSHSPNLRTLICFNCNLTSLNLTGLTHLESINCVQNEFQTLDLSGLSGLITVECQFNQLTSLILNGVSNLTTLKCFYNNLPAINVADAVNLQTLNCSYNQLVSLDVSNSTHLDEVVFASNPPLMSVFMKNGRNETNIFFHDCPNLLYVCADESQMTQVQQALTDAQLANVTVSNSYCSFTPGGNYNTISGNVKYDISNNGCDASDLNFPNIRINVNDGTTQGAVLTNTLGNYTTYMQSGSFEVSPAIENAPWFAITPSTVTIPFADNNNNLIQQNFCIAPVGYHPDVEVVISPIAFARPGFNATYQITFKNKGNQTFSEGIVGLQFEDSVLDFISATQLPFTQNGGNLNWLYTNLLPFESRKIIVTLNVNSPVEVPPVNNGDLLHFTVYTYPFEVDEHLEDNTFNYVQTIVGSYDPNDITCLEGDVVPPSEIGNYLHYAINFENTGTFYAENIVVKTLVDTTQFDMGSLQLLDTSHPVDARIEGNKAEFIFKHINLDIGGHGHILLKIKTLESLNTGDDVAKRADIFFDYNAPIDTGLANTVFQTLSNTGFDVDASVSVSPNPAVNEVLIKSNTKIKSIQLYDAQGRIVMTALVDDVISTFDISHQATGIYFIKIATEKGMKVQKLLKQ